MLGVFLLGVATSDAVQSRVFSPLQSLDAVALSADGLAKAISAPRVRLVDSLEAAVTGILEGWTAVFCPDNNSAVLVDTIAIPQAGPGKLPGTRSRELFSRLAEDNIGLVRRRLRTPDLVAEPLQLAQENAVAAVLYVAGRTDPKLVAQVRDWFTQHADAGVIRQGAAAGRWAVAGLLPKVLTIEYPDLLATLIGAGYAAVIIDQNAFAYATPVTTGALLLAAGDETLRLPIRTLMHAARGLLAAGVILLPGLTVALLSYHQEMFPTPFLLAVAVARENAALPTGAEMAALLGFEEIIREAASRPPLAIQPGQAQLAGILILIAGLIMGLVGPITTVVAIGVALTTYGLASHTLAYMCRAWRFWVLVAAVIHGLFGMAVVFGLLCVYIAGTASFGIPCLGDHALRLPVATDALSQGGTSRAQ